MERQKWRRSVTHTKRKVTGRRQRQSISKRIVNRTFLVLVSTLLLWWMYDTSENLSFSSTRKKHSLPAHCGVHGSKRHPAPQQSSKGTNRRGIHICSPTHARITHHYIDHCVPHFTSRLWSSASPNQQWRPCEHPPSCLAELHNQPPCFS